MGNDCGKTNENIYFKCRKEAALYDKRLFSRESAADLLGMSVSSLSDYELGITKVVPVDKVVLMADLYSHIYQRLSEIENKIESGYMVEFPCGWLDTVKLLTAASMCYAEIEDIIAKGIKDSKDLADLFMKIPRVQGIVLDFSLRDLANSNIDPNEISGFDDVLNAMPNFKKVLEEKHTRK